MMSTIQPAGGTKMRDSIMMGTTIMYSFRLVAEQLGLGQLWNFVHLVITDGKDEHSDTSFEDLGGKLHELQSVVPSGFMKTIYIGVDLENDQQALTELALLRLLGGNQAEIYRVDDSKIDDTFEKIKISLGIQIKREGIFLQSEQGTLGLVRQQNQVQLQVQRQRYMVFFNIDRSGSMQGKKWRNVCRAVDQFLKQLSSDDLVCGMVFSHEVEILSSMNKMRQIYYQALLALHSSTNQPEQKQSATQPEQKQSTSPVKTNSSTSNQPLQNKQIQQQEEIVPKPPAQQVNQPSPAKPQYSLSQPNELPYSQPKDSRSCSCSSSTCRLM